MDAALIANWNEVVGPDDHVYHIGDFAKTNVLSYKRKLHGKIHWVLGNHDSPTEEEKKEFESVDYLLRAEKINGQKICLFHYPCVTWWQKGYGTWHVYGHVHGKFSHPTDASLDVGVDCHNYRPISFQELKALIEKKINAKLQHPSPQESKTTAP